MKPRKKSRLQKRREDPQSSLWKRKADRLWSKIVAMTYGGKCALCGATEFVQAHHLIPREMFSHRYSIENGIALCPSHHKYSFILSAHRSSMEFAKWLFINHPQKWQWLMLQFPSKLGTKTFMEQHAWLETRLAEEVQKSTHV